VDTRKSNEGGGLTKTSIKKINQRNKTTTKPTKQPDVQQKQMQIWIWKNML
jgi:hypothetical protein